MDRIDIALASNERYVPGLKATLSSLILQASEKRRLCFHILDDGLSETTRQDLASLAKRCGLEQELIFQTLDMSLFKAKFKPYKGAHTAFMRLGLHSILDCDWVLYSDVDVLWFKDVCEIWTARDDRFPIAWCRDIPSICHGVKAYSQAWNPDFDETRYACSGVCLMNLKAMRRFNLLERSREFVETWGTPFFVDQDILNTFFMKDALLLDTVWDVTVPDRRVADGGVIHCCGIGGQFAGLSVNWRPLHAIWFLFYNRVVLGRTDFRLPFGRRLLFKVLAWLFPLRGFARLIFRETDQHFSEIQRTLFYSWLLNNRRFQRFLK